MPVSTDHANESGGCGDVLRITRAGRIVVRPMRSQSKAILCAVRGIQDRLLPHFRVLIQARGVVGGLPSSLRRWVLCSVL